MSSSGQDTGHTREWGRVGSSCPLEGRVVGKFCRPRVGSAAYDLGFWPAVIGTADAMTCGMAKEIHERAFRLALQVAMLERDDAYRSIVRRVVIQQLVRAATSIGSNLTEASAAHSKADFIAKVGIARKEARETQYWLRLGREARVLHAADWTTLLDEAEQVSRVVSAIARNAKRSANRGQ